ncbi:MAG TPA: 3-phosphoserine/phosphohydroxythreonine transaminase [Firmicutes bacterium]|nr:3-phosphoserine/phosphohydroxythreonine transaminase [Bacillota bacterium]
MNDRVFNFNPGPATLPLEALEEAQKELLNFNHTGMSVLEISHRSKEFEKLVLEAEALMKELMGLSDDFKVLFLQGGASMQFAMIPLNFLPAGKTADYVVTGSFAAKAQKEAAILGNTHIAYSTKEEGHKRIPRQEELNFSSCPAYVHITTNNTIYGTQWQYIPDTKGVPLVADMSSDILSRSQDYSSYSLIYAGAQKNLGPAGVTVVVVHRAMLEKVPATLPNILRLDVHAKNNSLYNTPPAFAIYMVNKVLHWAKRQGGLKEIENNNRQKAALIYDVIDKHQEFFLGHAEKNCRSIMNVTFRLPSQELENTFLAEAEKLKLVGLKGHRSVGGIRASIYNAMPRQGCLSLAQFMEDFYQKYA